MGSRSDILVVGFGPVGQALSLMLAQQGHTVRVVDRKSEPYPLPRAVCMDHEIRRVLLALGCGADLERCARPSPTYRWLNAQHQELLGIDWTVESISGGSEAYFFHQPSLEAALRGLCYEDQRIDIRLGWELRDLTQDDEGVTAVMSDRATGRNETVTARFLIGADGANSFVRRTLAIPQADLGFEADWLVVDVSAEKEEDFGVSGAVQICDPSRPTTMVPGGACGGRIFRRWEFMRLPSESRASLEDAEKVWSLLDGWTDRSKVQLHKHVVYTFRSLVAKTWRQGRILLAGDAAHVMPPFMGQGMCSGLRDAWNLAWKLTLVLRGVCREDLLDSYSVEREAHVTALIDSSVALGRIICVADPEKAAKRDAAFFAGSAPEMAPFPWLLHGLIASEPHASHLAGRLAPNGHVRVGGETHRLDDVTERGFLLITSDAADQDRLRATLAGAGGIGASVSLLGPAELPDPSDPINRFLTVNGLCAILVRPDFYIFGTAIEGAEVGDLLNHFIARMQAFEPSETMLPAKPTASFAAFA